MLEPRGRPRIEALFRRWLDWTQHNADLPGGCLFVALAAEIDDKVGPVRDQLADLQRQWQAMLARSAQIAIQEGHFRAESNPKQFHFETQGNVTGLDFYLSLIPVPASIPRPPDTITPRLPP